LDAGCKKEFLDAELHKGQLAVRAVKNTNEKLFLMSSNILEK